MVSSGIWTQSADSIVHANTPSSTPLTCMCTYVFNLQSFTNRSFIKGHSKECLVFN